MADQDKFHPVSRFLVTASAIVFLIWGISQAQSVLVSFLVSVFFSILAAPLVLLLGRKRIPAVVAVLIVVAGMILILLVIGLVVGTSINSFYTAIPQYQALIQEQITAFKNYLVLRNFATPDSNLLDFLNPGAVMSLTAGLFGRLGMVFSNIILIVLTVAFILLEATSFPVKLRAVLGDPQQIFPQFTKFADDMKRYMVIKTLLSLATGILVTIWLSILQVDFPILWGFLAFLLNFVPSLGSTIAAVPPILLAFLQFGVWMSVIAAVGCMTINLILDYGVEKRLMGRELGLSTLVVFLSLLFWGSLLGPVGAVLCIPLTMTLKFAFESSEDTRWIAVMLGPELLSRKYTAAVHKSETIPESKMA